MNHWKQNKIPLSNEKAEIQYMEKNNSNKADKTKNKIKYQEVLLLFLTVLAGGAAAFLYGKSQIEIIRIIILVIIGFGSVIFLLEESREQKLFLFDNEQKFGRFILIYLISLVGSTVFALLPVGGWPYLAIFVGLMLFSNQAIGLVSGSVLLLISCLLKQETDANLFFIYFTIGVVGTILFSYVNESFKIWLPICISLLMQAVCLSLHSVLFVNETLNLQMFMISGINILVCLILLLIILKFFSVVIVYRKKYMYMDINDPECPLLVDLKNLSRDEYYHAIHTAYLCNRIAKRLNLDDSAAKAGGYYHKIGILKGENNWENVSAIGAEYQFPPKVCEILKEYVDKNEILLSKESVILLFSDTLISSIHYLFSKDSKVELDYPKLIAAIFKKKLESGIVDSSQITLGEINEMKKILVEEKLYYDFLR